MLRSFGCRTSYTRHHGHLRFQGASIKILRVRAACMSLFSEENASLSHKLKLVTNHNFQTCPEEAKSPSMFYETFSNMSIKQASQPCAWSTKSAALARRMSFIATYKVIQACSTCSIVSIEHLPSPHTWPEGFIRSTHLSMAQIWPWLCGT